MVEQGDFESLGLGLGWWSSAWFAPGEVVGQGCEECSELRDGEAGCTLAVQRSFLVWLEVLCRHLTLIFLLPGGAVA